MTKRQEERWTRRRFVATAASAAGLASAPSVAAWGDSDWRPGSVVHILPTANHERLAIKVSFTMPIADTPVLHVGDLRTEGRATDSARQYFSFDIDGLASDVEYPLALRDAGGQPYCDPWSLRTFPHPEASPKHVRLVAYTCAGGHPDDSDWFLPLEVRRRLLQRALSFSPQAVIAIGDHIYYDQRTELENRGEEYGRRQREFYEQVGWLDRAKPALGTSNEVSLKAAVGPQIGQLYGTLLRSTPSFFVSDDHDYFENDDADENMVTFPPDHYQLDFARYCRHLFLPEFLPDPYRPASMPGAGAGDRAHGISEAFGTLRYGRLLETLIYDCARFLSLKDDHAGLIPPEAERWLHDRTQDRSVAQLLHVPSHPFGWSAGKWREWYPDVLDVEGGARPGTDAGDVEVGLTTDRQKYLWQSGWWHQHQRLLASLNAQASRPAVVLSGDLHAIGHSAIERSHDLDLTGNPVHAVLTGTLGTHNGWPSDYRGTPPLPAIGTAHEGYGEVFEKNGFTVLDVTTDSITVRLFAWKTGEPESAIDSLAPYHSYTIKR